MNRHKSLFILVSNDLTTDQRMHRTAKYFRNRGWEVTMIGRSIRSSQPLSEQKYGQIRLPMWFQKGPTMYFELVFRMVTYLWRKRIDMIISVDLDTILAGASLKRFGKTKYLVFDGHEHFTEVPELQYRTIAKSIWSWIGRISVPYADVCLTVNESLSHILGKMYNRDFYFIYNVPSFIKQTPKTNDDQPYILYQGAINAGRGLKELILAMPMIDSLDLWIIGHGDLMSEMKDLREKSPVASRIFIKGQIDPSDLPTLSSNAYIGVNLLDGSSLNYYYSLANKFFDYIHAGIPSVHMAFPEYVTLMTKYKVGVIIPDLDPHIIANAINGLIHDKSTYDMMVYQCRLASQNFNWDLEQKKWDEICKKLIL